MRSQAARYPTQIVSNSAERLVCTQDSPDIAGTCSNNTEEFESCRPFGMHNARVPAMPSDLVCKLERNSRLLDSSLQRR